MLLPSLRSPRAVALLALALPCLSAPALAEPTGAEKAQAEALFREGRRLAEEKKFAEACPKFAESQRLDPGIGTLINLALCHEEDNRTASAWGEFMDAANLAQRAGDAKRAQFARDRAQKLEAKLSRLTISGAAVEGIAITLDGRPFGVGALGAPLPVDPGEHVVAAQAPGKKKWEGRVTVAVGPASVSIAIPALVDATPEPPPPPAIAPPPVIVTPPVIAPPEPPPDAKAPSNGRRIAGAVVGSVGLAGVVIGAVTGGLAFAKESDARKACPNTACPTQQGLDLHDGARRFATVSTVSFIAGGAALAGGVVLLVLSRGGDKPAQAAWIAPQLGGIAAGGKW